tara:strand:+ start:236 stop:625 length:390 start_codon:yes stop_codon:yes gene_type:complete
LRTAKQKNSFRWVLLRHIGDPEDIRGIHFDLLLEDKEVCRSWRLSNIPVLDGPFVEAISIAPHKLYWLDVQEKVVSGNRGIATKVKEGIFFKSLTSIQNRFINLAMQWDDIQVYLVINNKGCRIFRTNQ